MTTDFPATIAEAGEWLRSGRVSSVELTSAFLARAEVAQDTVGAFMTFTQEAALAAAQRADQERANGVDRGPLHGIPLGIKDILATTDAPSTANSRVLDPTWGQRSDATTVRKLREAGAVILGKLVLHEFAIGFPDPATGLRYARNPWDLSRIPGGSSSGTAAALAAGLILGGLGTDTGGSIRGPASLCGISGLKPTYGRVSKEGCVPLSYSLDHIGPMARTMRDCAAMLQVIAGYDPLDPCSANVDVPDFSARLDGSLSSVRVGIPRDYFFDQPQLNAEVRQAVLEAVDELAHAGADIRDVRLPSAPLARIAQRTIMLSEAYAYHQADLARQPQNYGKYTRSQILVGSLYSGADYVQAQRMRSVIVDEVRRAMADLDVLVMPMSLTVASTFEGYDPDGMRKAPNYSAIWNVTGQPAASICCGFSSDGLPIGLQIVGKAFDDGMVLRVGDAYQRLTDWHQRTPAATREVQPA